MTVLNKSRKIKIFSVFIIITLFLCGEFLRPISTFGLSEPEISGGSACLYCENTDEMIYEKEKEKKINPYSTTKLLTALVVLDKLDLDREVTISKKAAKQDGSSMDLKEGEVVTVDELLHGLLIMSGNDAAYALAEETAGSTKSFAKLMNKKAKQLGMSNSHFTNPAGLKEKGHYTTAEDFLKLAKEVFKNKYIVKVSGVKRYEMRKTNREEKRIMKTHLDGRKKSNSGVIAGKTGFWQIDDCSIVVLYKKDDLKLIGIIFEDNLEDRPEDAQALFKYARESIPRKKALSKNENLGKAWVRCGKVSRTEIISDESAYIYEKKGKQQKIKIRNKINHGIKAPLKKGDKVGKAYIYYGNKRIKTVNLVAKKNIEKGWLPSYIYISNNMTKIILLTIFVLFSLLMVIRKYNKNKYKKAAYGGKH